MTKLTLAVTEVEPLSPLVKRFRLEDPDGAPLPVFSGGAHLSVEIPKGEILHRNSYSLISDPNDTTGYEIAVRREDAGRGGSVHMHTQVAVGDRLTVSMPITLFSLDLRAKKHVLLAGGIGVTPFLSQLRQIAAMGHEYELHYAVPTRAEAAALSRLPADPRVHLHVSDEGTRMDVGAILAAQPIGTHVYTCGPDALIHAVSEQASALGWPQSALHFEAFTPQPPGEPFAVTIASTGQVVRVGADQSLLEALEAAEVPVNYSCRGGACGRCETAVTTCAGEIQHNDHWLSDAERAAQKTIMPCMSRFKGTHLELAL